MIEQALKPALEKLTGLDVYPLLLPKTQQQGVTFQRISDPSVGTGLSPTGLSDVRMQLSFYLINDYTRLLQFDKAVWDAWKSVIHDEIEGQRVQLVRRGSIRQGQQELPNGNIQYSLIRDFIFTVAE